MDYPSTLQGRNPIANAAARERDINCIEMTLKNIEAELSEGLNSASNLADKLAGQTINKGVASGECPVASDVSSRLGLILNIVRGLNQELGRAHSAISG